MKIVVTVKVASTLDGSARLQGDRVDPASMEWDLNEWDRFAVEAALQLKEASEDGEVVVVSVGGDETEDGLLTALAMGADRAIQVNVEDEAQNLDAISTARVIAKAIEAEAPDLILCGTQSSDGASAATGTALAALLDLPCVAVVRSIEHASGELTVVRELEGGLLEKIMLSVPALLTVQTGVNEPRYANLRGIRQAASKPREQITIGELGLDRDELSAGSAQLVSLTLPPAGDGAQILEGDGVSVASQIAQIIKSKLGS
jgi:electron transfer flavoprotein beta subunit